MEVTPPVVTEIVMVFVPTLKAISLEAEPDVTLTPFMVTVPDDKVGVKFIEETPLPRLMV
jgi:hypothetical protein